MIVGIEYQTSPPYHWLMLIIEEQKLNITQIQGQILQLNHYKKTKVVQYFIKITRTVSHCGYNNHIMNVLNGRISFYKEITRGECFGIYETGRYVCGSKEIYDIPRNGTHSVPVTFAGTLTNNARCWGVDYSDHYGEWSNVVVDGHIEIKISSYDATVNLDTNKIILNSGTSCLLTDTHCMDIIEGYAFWSPLPEDACNTFKYSVLYEGLITKTEELEGNSRIVYSVEEQDMTVALLKIGEKPICGYELIRTEHPQLFIIEDIREKLFKTKN